MHVWSFEIGLLEHSGAYGHKEHGGTWHMDAAQLDTQRKKGEAILKTSSTVYSTNRSSSSTRPAKLQLDRAEKSTVKPEKCCFPLDFPLTLNLILFLSALLVELRKYRKAIGYTLDDIKGISPDLCIHRIHLEDESKFSIEPQRRLNPNLKEVVKKEILKLLDAGIIYPISDSTWISPVHCVPKKGGITVIKNDKEELIPTRTIVGHRMCIDYRKLNSASRKDHFPLPFIDQMLERLANHPFYCFLDGYSGFFQIPIHPNDQEKTTFTCPYGTFAYRRMPFGMCNSPATFQRCMTSIFSDLIEEMVEVFMDDFSVYGASFSSCLSNLCRVLQRCEETNLVLNWEKCHFMTVKDIRSFLGHAGFYRRFIKDFSKIARPLTRLLCKEIDFEFDEECHKSWTLLKDALVFAPIVQAPNWDYPFEIMCDASDYAVGACLAKRYTRNSMSSTMQARLWMMLNASMQPRRKSSLPSSLPLRSFEAM
ncbi:unnamed protein product [Microthlaspi erraticum]|uniref:Reverse transcriptase domain-containing protein n=1 Tax=Microthlaspi erraticum TaxID=1685480 RepID=A0A6D2IRT2_9BRAS|nr:unnamed protein product [Microthlaspi erraticum]